MPKYTPGLYIVPQNGNLMYLSGHDEYNYFVYWIRSSKHYYDSPLKLNKHTIKHVDRTKVLWKKL